MNKIDPDRFYGSYDGEVPAWLYWFVGIVLTILMLTPIFFLALEWFSCGVTRG